MEVASGFQCLLRNLKMDDPWVPPKTWESIASESGTARKIELEQGPQDTMYDLSAASEANLVRLVISALQGVKSAIVEIDKLSFSFCSNPADRSFHRVPSLWCRLSSTHAMGRMLKSISYSGLLFYFLSEFVSYFLCTNHKANSARRGNVENFLIPSNQEGQIEMQESPPYSLVNQAFAVAIGKLLEGYICALNTLLASIKLRRSVQCKGESSPIYQPEGTLTGVVHSEITFMEVYLHTKELSTRIETLGSICFSQTFKEALSLDSIVDFHNFPRGADLLTYLYIQLQDADTVHHTLLKYLFVHSYKPYSDFIKLWMYRATIDDPYGEFFVASSDTTPTTDTSSLSFKFSLASIKERSGVSIPCFLKDVCHQLLRAGQQLQILLKLLDLCDLSFSGEYAPCDLSVLREILPFWVGSSSELDLSSNPLIFDVNVVEALIQKRELKFRNMLEKLQNHLKKFSANNRWASHNVIAFGSMPILLGRSVKLSFPSVFDGESNLMHGNINVASGDADSDASSSTTESGFELELSLSSECSSHDYNDESIADDFNDLHDSVCRPSKSMFSNLPADHAKNSILQTYANRNWPSLHPSSFHTSTENLYPITFCSHAQHQIRKTNQIAASPKSNAIKDLRIFENLTEVCQSGGCWPLGGLLRNPFCAYMKCRGPQQLRLAEYCFENDDGGTDKFSCEETFFAKAFGPFMISFDGSREMPTSTGTFGSLSRYLSSFSWHHSFISMHPMLTKTLWLPTVGNLKDTSFINKHSSYLPNFNFSSLTDPFKHHLESRPLSSGDRSKVETSMSGQLGGSAGGVEYSGGTINETVGNQPISTTLCSAGETNSQRGDQLLNASGGADWAKTLKYPIKKANYGDDDIHLEQKFLIPLDIIVDRCILQEILLQYKYISFFAIKFLEEGFNLREHLLALRRYHFMEISDWADLFVMSLGCQKWSALEQQETYRIQRLLDLALQRSSCENDPYKERLFVYIKGQSGYQPVFTNGIHAFDFVALGYRVDWPVNIVVTEDALQIYADIFSYLIRIRLAISSLIDIWHYLKDVLYVLKHGQQISFREMEDFNSLMRMRQQIYHFVTTLQQYVQSQLSDVSWCQFQDSLKHTVKDILDLESVHMLYLADAVHICFLSDDAREVATIIKNILQCALDFRLCFSGIGFTGHLFEKAESYLRSQINFTQVSTVNSSFQKNLKELYFLYLKSPKHSDVSLHRFWNHLNFNGYFSTVINKELGYSHL